MKTNLNQIFWPLLALFYFVTRLINLKIIPIFTDEAIYTYWAQIALNDPVNRFVSLEDGKQPLFIWLSAIYQKFIADPLIASRLISATAGMGSLIGIHLLANELFNKKVAMLSSLLYIILPFTLLYDRMALFDSLLTMFGIYAVLLSIRMAKNPMLDTALLNGFAIGLALITKSSGIFFLYLLPISLFLFDFKNRKFSKRLSAWIGFSLITFVISQLIYNSLRLSPLFYIIERKNLEFIRSFAEVLNNPFLFAFSNFKSLASWIITYTSWPLFILFLIALLWGYFKKDVKIIYLSILIFAPFFAEVIFNKILYPRFTLFYYPYIIILISFGAILIIDIFKKHKRYLVVLLFIALILPAFTSFKLLTDPAYANIPKSDSDQYFNDWPAGYGIEEIVEFIKSELNNGEVHVATEGTFGLLPFALNIYFYGNNNLHILSYWPLDPDNLPEEILDTAKKYKTYAIFYQTQKETTNPNLEFIVKFQKGKGASFMRLFEVIP